MSISTYIVPISKASELSKLLLTQEFEISDENAEVLYNGIIKRHLDQLKDDLFIVAETNYIDRVFRDSYYHYYSSKLANYKRNCTRLSLFAAEVEMDDFRDESRHAKLQSLYRGFLVLRPIQLIQVSFCGEA